MKRRRKDQAQKSSLGSEQLHRGQYLRLFSPYGTVLTLDRIHSTIRHRMVEDLGRGDWLHAARVALLRGGMEAVRVEKLARSLGVTKGSFYWHFQDRDELLELLLREWESEVAEILSQAGRGDERTKVHRLVRLLEQRAKLSEAGKAPSDAAIFAWASVDRAVARRVNKAEEERIELLKHFMGGRDRIELFYLVWLGFVARGQRVPESRKRFPEIAQLLLESLSEPRTKRRTQQRSRKPNKHPAKLVRRHRAE